MTDRRSKAAISTLSLAVLLAGCSDANDVKTTTTTSVAADVTTTTLAADDGGPGATIGGGPTVVTKPGSAATATTRPSVAVPGTQPPPVVLGTVDVTVRVRVAAVDSGAGTFTLREPVSGYSAVLTTPTTSYATTEGEPESFASIDAGAILTITGRSAGAGRLQAAKVVFIA